MVIGRAANSFANLPRPLTSLIGWEADVSTLSARLMRPDVCLLTPTGLPGVVFAGTNTTTVNPQTLH